MGQPIGDERAAVRQRLARQKRKTGTRIGDDVFDFGFAKARVDGNSDSPCHLRPEKRNAPIEPVTQSNRDPVASVDA